MSARMQRGLGYALLALPFVATWVWTGLTAGLVEMLVQAAVLIGGVAVICAGWVLVSRANKREGRRRV